MDDIVVNLSRWQFAITTIYHFFFVPLTIGLSVLVAILETAYVRTGKEIYKQMTKFWGKLFVINFAMGVVTGIVLEFQFGMNWSEYSRFVGDIFGAPLAIEALLAFFLESIFLGVWLFGWDKLSKKIHLISIWLVAFGSTISAFWILVANSFMQSPVGFVEENGRLVMSNFWALITNPNIFVQFPHTVLGGFVTGAFFMIGVSAYHIIRNQNLAIFNFSIRLASIFGIISILLVILVGHSQGQHMVQTQPMKMAAAEALWHSENPAGESVFVIVDQKNQKNIVSLRIPAVLSLLAYNQFTGEVKGMLELQSTYENLYGPGNYIPPITITYWAFRAMIGAGFLMFLIVALVLLAIMRKKELKEIKVFKFMPFVIALPYLANSSGWILTEMGRQPWVVYGYQKTVDAVSTNLSNGMVWMSFIGFLMIYGILIFADIYLLSKYARSNPIMIDENQSDENISYWD
jgi:cytochrome d ubiquinol oxidase subunit I